MNRRTFPLTALIALSLLTAGLALAGTPTSLASPTVPAEEDGKPQGPRNLTLDGQVVNESSGEPIEGVQVEVGNAWTSEDGHYRSHDRFETTTNETGHYEIDVSEGEVDLTVDEPRYQRLRTEFQIEDDVTLDLPLKEANGNRTTILGTVTSEEGEPIEGAHVRVHPAPRDCPDEDPCRHPEPARERRDEDRRSEREVETSQGTVTLVYEPRTDRHVSDETGSDGSYEVRVPPGSYQVRAHAEDHLDARTIVEGRAGDHVQANLSLEAIPPATVTVEGVVQDAQTGEPIEWAQISVDNQRWGTYNRTHTDEDGRFSMQVRPGYAHVDVHANEEYYVPCAEHGRTAEGVEPGRARQEDCDPHRERDHGYLPWSSTIQPEAGQTVQIEEDLNRQPAPSSTFEGWVVNASSGEPVPNATLVFENEVTNEWGRATAGPNGSYQIDVREGYYTVRVQAKGFFGNVTNLAIQEDQVRRVSLNLTPGEPADSRYRVYPVSTSTSAAGGDASASTQTDALAENDPGGRQAFSGGAGDLGPYPGLEQHGEPSSSLQASSIGLVGAGVSLAMAAAVVRRRTSR